MLIVSDLTVFQKKGFGVSFTGSTLTMKIEEFASKTTERVTRQNQAEEIASKCQQELMEKEQAMDLKLEELKDRLSF